MTQVIADKHHWNYDLSFKLWLNIWITVIILRPKRWSEWASRIRLCAFSEHLNSCTFRIIFDANAIILIAFALRLFWLWFWCCWLLFLFAGQYIDLDYSIWLWRVLTPLIVTFLLPMVFVLLIYLSSCFLYIYKLHR